MINPIKVGVEVSFGNQLACMYLFYSFSLACNCLAYIGKKAQRRTEASMTNRDLNAGQRDQQFDAKSTRSSHCRIIQKGCKKENLFRSLEVLVVLGLTDWSGSWLASLTINFSMTSGKPDIWIFPSFTGKSRQISTATFVRNFHTNFSQSNFDPCLKRCQITADIIASHIKLTISDISKQNF